MAGGGFPKRPNIQETSSFFSPFLAAIIENSVERDATDALTTLETGGAKASALH